MNKKLHVNYKHLRYFREVARRGSVGAAAKALFVAPQTVSSQLLELETQLGHALFERIGRGLKLTVSGELVLEYAESIFALGDELVSVLSNQHPARRLSLRVGITDSIPKLLAVGTLEPVINRNRQRVELMCNEGSFNELIGKLVTHDLDMVLADMPAPATLGRSLQSKLLSSSGMSFLAAPSLARTLGKHFPDNLNGAPLLLNTSASSTLSHSLESWLARHEIHAQIVGRFDDSALMKGFAQRGLGVVTAPTSIEKLVASQHQLKVIGRAADLLQQLFLIRARRERNHPLIAELEQTGTQ